MAPCATPSASFACTGSPVAARCTALVRHHCPGARLVCGVADLRHLRAARQAGQQRRPELIEGSRALRAAELHAARAADAVTTRSSREGRLLAAQCAPGRVHVVPRPVPVQPVSVLFAKRSGLASVGCGGHAPNRDAARWLVDGTMPLVWRRAPATGGLLVGGGLPDGLARPSDPRVAVLGHVPRWSEVFERVRLAVTPTWGAGLKGKVAESLAAGVPCVCTPVAAEGYNLSPVLADLVADGAEALAEKIAALHDSPAWLRACSRAGLAPVRRDFSEGCVDRLIAGAWPERPPWPTPGSGRRTLKSHAVVRRCLVAARALASNRTGSGRCEASPKPHAVHVLFC